MSTQRRGFAVLLTGGDAELSGALAKGIRAVRGKGDDSLREGDSLSLASPASSLREGALGEDVAAVDPAALEADSIAREWLDRQRLSRAVGNRRTAEDYETLITKARGDYGHNPTGSLYRRFWALLGLLVLAANGFAEWEERCWRGNMPMRTKGGAGHAG